MTRTRVTRLRARDVAVLALLLLCLVPLAGCGKYGPPQRTSSHARAEATSAAPAGATCEDEEAKPPESQP